MEKTNQINTSIKLPIYIKVKNSNNLKISGFEKVLENTDLIYDFLYQNLIKIIYIFKLFIMENQVIFLKTMSDNNFNFDTQNKIWILK